MKYECDVIRDLIPLYIDDVASTASRRMVEEHLAECADCRALLGRMKSEEVETAINFEKEDVIAGQRRFFKRRSAVIGSVIAGIFMVPVLICLIVNLASGSGLDWFFIVLAALLVAASLLVVPLMAPENKGLWTLGSFTVSLLLLFGVCCLYTGGRWFFVAGSAVLFGLSLVFLPFAVRSRLLADYLEDRKGLAVVTADTVLLALMMLAIGLHTGSAGFFRIAVPMTVLVILIVWALFFIIRNARQVKTKQDFLVRLEEELSDLPKEETAYPLYCKDRSENGNGSYRKRGSCRNGIYRKNHVKGSRRKPEFQILRENRGTGSQPAGMGNRSFGTGRTHLDHIAHCRFCTSVYCLRSALGRSYFALDHHGLLYGRRCRERRPEHLGIFPGQRIAGYCNALRRQCTRRSVDPPVLWLQSGDQRCSDPDKEYRSMDQISVHEKGVKDNEKEYYDLACHSGLPDTRRRYGLLLCNGGEPLEFQIAQQRKNGNKNI